MGAFQRAANRAFARAVLDRAPRALREVGLSPAEALACVEASIEAARSFGFLGHTYAERFARLSLRHGPGFESTAWARAVLWDADLTTEARITELERAAAREPTELR